MTAAYAAKNLRAHVRLIARQSEQKSLTLRQR